MFEIQFLESTSGTSGSLNLSKSLFLGGLMMASDVLPSKFNFNGTGTYVPRMVDKDFLWSAILE